MPYALLHHPVLHHVLLRGGGSPRLHRADDLHPDAKPVELRGETCLGLRARTIEADDDDEQTPARRVLAEVAGVIYQVSADGECEMLLPGRRPLEARQPTAGLPPVIGAEESGRETVNGVQATRYTFDARATTYGDQAVAEGQLWVAEQGGYVLRYELTVSGVIGDDVDGVVTWSYSLEPTGAVGLPAECAHVAVDAPLPDDAARILRGHGIMIFETQLGVAEGAALYADRLPPLGWTLESEEALEGGALVDYLRGEQRLTLTARALEVGGTEVILVVRSAEE